MRTDTDVIEPVRTRLRWVLFGTVGLMSSGYIAAVTVSTLAARSITGSELLAGIPSAIAVISTAVGTSTLGNIVVRSGRRRSLLVGVLVAVLGAAISVLAVFQSVFLLLILGMSLMGFGNAASHLSRYAAADMVAPGHRGSAVSTVVWAGTIGAVLGPRLLGPSGDIAEGLGTVQYAGGYISAVAFIGAASLVLWLLLRPDPTSVGFVDSADTSAQDTEVTDSQSVFRRPKVQLAITAMVIGQLVMVLIMTATPIHVENNGFDLALVGSIISAHTLGMFAFAPLVGRAVDRTGPIPMMIASAVVLVGSAVMAATAPTDATTMLSWALFLLGLGWNFSFVAGSTLLSVSIEPTVRPLIQGRVDSMVWGSSALASASSGPLLAGPGYTFLSYMGALLVLGLLVMLGRQRVVPAI